MFMNTANKLVEEIEIKKSSRFKLHFFVIGMIIIIALIFAGISYYQATRFNSEVTINDIKVGGLTADQVIDKFKTSKLKNRVYIGEELILDEKDTHMAFTDQDIPEVKKFLKSQWTFFPSSKVQKYTMIPNKPDQFRSETMKKQLEEKLLSHE